MTGRPRIVIRPACPSDHGGLRVLASELAYGPLLSRYGSDPHKLGDELCQLCTPPAGSATPTESLLVAVVDAQHHGQAAPAAAPPSSTPVTPAPAPLLGFARYAQSGMFGSLGGYLKLIAIAASHTGQGTGSRLLAAVEDAVRIHSRDLFLLASHFNEGAHRFYGRHGYQEVGRLPDYVRTEITELIFWKRLRPK